MPGVTVDPPPPPPSSIPSHPHPAIFTMFKLVPGSRIDPVTDE